MLQSVLRTFIRIKEKLKLLASHFKPVTLVMTLVLFAGGTVFGQQPAVQPVVQKEDKKEDKKEEKKPATNDSAKSDKKAAELAAKDALKNPTAELIAESVIYIYGLGGGRAVLNQIRKTSLERGKISVANADGKMDQASYQRWTQRAETLGKEKIRLDQEFATARYALVFNDQKIFGIVDDQVFVPREDASKAFENQIIHGMEALLRYKENGSKIDLVGKEKVLGVEYFIIDVTDDQSRKTRFYISAKSYRIMMLDYEEASVKYRRKFYDYNYAQGTLFPFRTTLFVGDKVVEETEVGTITFGQKIDEAMFSAG